MIFKSAPVLVFLLLTACARAAEPALSLPDASLLDDSETLQLGALRDHSYRLLANKDYDRLEKVAATDRAAESFLGSGLSPIAPFYEGMVGDHHTETPEACLQKLDALNAWIQARPDSVTAKIALANSLTNYAWAVRGSGYANTVSADAWTVFNQKLQQASDTLASVKDKRQAYPDWYMASGTVGMGMSEEKEAFLATAREGNASFPKSVEIYARAVIYLLPRWYGSNQEIVDYATKSADQLGGDDGDMLYARLAKTLWCYSRDINVFSDTGLSWPRVRHGMELICNRYPHSRNMANVFCALAYLAEDRDSARILFNYLGDHPSPNAWVSRDQFEKARAWAQSSG